MEDWGEDCILSCTIHETVIEPGCYLCVCVWREKREWCVCASSLSGRLKVTLPWGCGVVCVCVCVCVCVNTQTL